MAGRPGGREAGRQGGREAGRPGGREAGRQGGREAGRHVSRVFLVSVCVGSHLFLPRVSFVRQANDS